jgi:hypothetical protein
MEIGNSVAHVELYEAFAACPGGGNPAGVVLDAHAMSEHDMQAVAREVGVSETAFVTDGDGPHTYRIRYFSPKVEVPFCGHATIATAIALAEHRGVDEMVMLTPGRPCSGADRTPRRLPCRVYVRSSDDHHCARRRGRGSSDCIAMGAGGSRYAIPHCGGRCGFGPSRSRGRHP